jgi:hypothetical protein
MFLSPDGHHGIPAPFPPDQEWEFMSCPWCRNRPFVEPDQVLIQVEGAILKTFEPFTVQPAEGYSPVPTEEPEPIPPEVVHEDQPTAPEPEKFVCPVCSKEFPRSNHLANHMRSHNK